MNGDVISKSSTKLVESLLVRNFRHDDVALDPIAGEGISIGWRQC